jgi:predicted DNA-binding WGR domain protein
MEALSTPPEDFYQTSFDLFNQDYTEADQDYPVHLGTSDPVPLKSDILTELERRLKILADGYAVYCFAKDTPEKNCFRRYTITYQPSLWDKYTVSRQWGRIGSEKFQRRDEHFPASHPALNRVRRLVSRRLRRGYQLINLI